MIRLVTFLGGLYFFLEFLLPQEFFGFSFAPYHESITNGFIAVGVTAIGLGLISIFRVHGGRIARLSSGWFPSTLLIASMLGMIFVTGYEAVLDRKDASLIAQGSILREFALKVRTEGGNGVLTADARTAIAINSILGFERALTLKLEPSTDVAIERDVTSARTALVSAASIGSRESLGAVADGLSQLLTAVRAQQAAVRNASLNSKVYNVLYQGFWTALAAAMFSLLGFYIAAAAFRAFRVRSFESALMMGSAVVVMLGQIPFGVWLHEGLPALRAWLLSVPSSAAFRAIRIGAGIAALLMGIRMWLSLDRRRGSL